MKKNLRIVIALVLLVGIGAAGAGVTWWNMRAKPPGKAVEKLLADGGSQKYVSLDKVIVMLRRSAGETTQHYLAADLVFKTTEEKERIVKAHLPMLRSEAVKMLSDYSMEKASNLTVSQLAAVVDRALTERYARERQAKPFSEVMVGKLIIE